MATTLAVVTNDDDEVPNVSVDFYDEDAEIEDTLPDGEDNWPEPKFEFKAD